MGPGGAVRETRRMSEPVAGDLDRLVAAATQARERAHVPYSGFAMGAGVLTDTGRIVTGCLVENVSLPMAVCAERVALLSTWSQDAGRPVALAVVAAATAGSPTFPCGACLQVAIELAGPDLVVVAATPGGEREVRRLGELGPCLPHRPDRAPR